MCGCLDRWVLMFFYYWRGKGWSYRRVGRWVFRIEYRVSFKLGICLVLSLEEEIMIVDGGICVSKESVE